MELIKNIKIRMNALQMKQKIECVQNDNAITIHVELEGLTLSSTRMSATVFVRKPSGKVVYQSAIVTGEYILVNLYSQALAEVGVARAQVQVKEAGDVITSFEFDIDVKESLSASSATQSGSVIDALESLVAREVQKIGVDATLSRSGVAADAKATGDAIASTVKTVNNVLPDANGNVTVQTSDVDPNDIKQAVMDYLIENGASNYNDTALRNEIALLKRDKLQKPQSSVGNIYKVKSINSDGSVVLESVTIDSMLTNYIKTNSYATSSKAGVVKIGTSTGLQVSTDGNVDGATKTADEYTGSYGGLVITKGTLENAKESIVTSVGDTLYASKSEIVPEDVVATWASGESPANSYIKKHQGLVHIFYQGQSKTHANGDVLGTLPASCRPKNQCFIPFVVPNGAFAYGTVSINTDGAIKVGAISNNTLSGRIVFNGVFPI